MDIGKRLALVALGYALAVAGGYAFANINEALIPADVQQSSGGMVAFGDMVVFVIGTGVLSLLPTWFLLKLLVAKAPRALLAALLLLAVIGPISWLTVIHLAGRPPASPAHAIDLLLGPLVAFGAIPRIVAGPILVVIEGATFVLAKERGIRSLLGAAMLMDIVPIGLYVLRFATMAYS
jgi:hypothetical protein